MQVSDCVQSLLVVVHADHCAQAIFNEAHSFGLRADKLAQVEKSHEVILRDRIHFVEELQHTHLAFAIEVVFILD